MKLDRHQIRDHEKQCAGKFAYETKARAKKVLSQWRHKRRTGVVVYRCPHCDGFHIGNETQQR